MRTGESWGLVRCGYLRIMRPSVLRLLSPYNPQNNWRNRDFTTAAKPTRSSYIPAPAALAIVLLTLFAARPKYNR
jgi:hypothetical protein